MVYGLLPGQYANTLGAIHKDLVAHEGGVVLLDHGREVFQELPYGRFEIVGDVPVEATDPEVAVVHAHAGDHLEDLEDLLALPVRVEVRRQSADVEQAGTEEEQVTGDPVQFGEDDPDALGPFGHLGVHELLDRQDVGEVVAKAVQVIHPVGVGDALLVGAVLHGLLETGVQVTYLRLDRNDPFAVEVDDEAQDAVCGGVL